MTDDDALKLARDCGMFIPVVLTSCITNKDELLDFAAAVERVTLDRAAKVCEEIEDSEGETAGCSEAIRALATPENPLDIRPENGEIQVVTLSQDYVVGD